MRIELESGEIFLLIQVIVSDLNTQHVNLDQASSQREVIY